MRKRSTSLVLLLALLLTACASRESAPPPSSTRVAGYQVSWPCPETARGPIPVGRTQPWSTACKDGGVAFILSTLDLAEGTAEVLSDEELFAIQLEQLETLAAGPVDFAPLTVGAVDLAGESRPRRFPARRFGFDGPDNRVMGLSVRDGDRLYNLTAVGPPSDSWFQSTLDVVATFVLVLADDRP